jgi:hypothetical protein
MISYVKEYFQSRDEAQQQVRIQTITTDHSARLRFCRGLIFQKCEAFGSTFAVSSHLIPLHIVMVSYVKEYFQSRDEAQQVSIQTITTDHFMHGCDSAGASFSTSVRPLVARLQFHPTSSRCIY